MEHSLTVSLTPKGVEEVKTRAYKLHIRKRSILLLLERPQTIRFLLDKGVYPQAELMVELDALAREGFIQVSGAGGQQASLPVAPRPAPAAPSLAGGIALHPEIIASEARFLLVNFCVDTFGTAASSLVEALGGCRSTDDFGRCAQGILDLIKAQYPQAMPLFQQVIAEVNKTAE